LEPYSLFYAIIRYENRHALAIFKRAHKGNQAGIWVAHGRRGILFELTDYTVGIMMDREIIGRGDCMKKLAAPILVILTTNYC
jgi:hypothetical protein